MSSTFEERQWTVDELMLSSLLSLELVYMVLAAQYESLRDPPVVMLSSVHAGAPREAGTHVRLGLACARRRANPPEEAGMHRVSHYLRTLISFAIFAVGGGVMSWLVLPCVWLLARDRESATRHCQSTLQAVLRSFLWLLARLQLFKPDWQLLESRKPVGPCVIVCNHPCLLDTVTMVARYDHVVCLVKQSYYDNPLFFGLAKLCGFVPAGREGSVRGHQRMIEEALDRLRRGYNVLAFPESRRTPLVERLPFRRGPFEIAARGGVPIVPVQLTCTPRILTREMSLHQMPLVCVRYTAHELPRQYVESGRNGTKDAAQRLQNLLQVNTDDCSREEPSPRATSPRP